jgi:NADH-quinone oxidoreductase subunit G
VHLGLPDVAAARKELAVLTRGNVPAATAGVPARAAGIGGSGGASPPDASTVVPGPGRALLATWHNLLDAGRMQDGEPNLAGTARAAVTRMSAATAAEAGTTDGGKVTIATSRGQLTLPVETAEMPDRVVWLPANSAGCAVRQVLGAGHGSEVIVRSPG